MYGRNYLTRTYDDNTILDKAEARAIFLKWYEKEISDETGKFIVQSVMLPKMLLLYLVNCHFKYKNNLTIHILVLLLP